MVRTAPGAVAAPSAGHWGWRRAIKKAAGNAAIPREQKAEDNQGPSKTLEGAIDGVLVGKGSVKEFTPAMTTLRELQLGNGGRETVRGVASLTLKIDFYANRSTILIYG